MLAQGVAALPLSLEAVKRATRQDFGDDDVLLEAYLRAATGFVETAARRPLAPRAVTFMAEETGWRTWWLPVAPVISVTQVAVMDPAGAWAPLPEGSVRLLNGAEEPRLALAEGVIWPERLPGSPIRISAEVGYADPEDYPAQLLQAITLVVRDWYLAGLEPGDGDLPALQFGAKLLINQLRYRRPQVCA
ncbi:hypothetical protein [Oceanicella sp. SM1341]|uniref:head-tail connector protein n=1 Tax=Oceanicella sp. SM1341 TaxID=1548889 RepID=UPI0013009DBA|nr:hypothetical protein [Oceanicella sp. SM1341]